MQGLVGEQPLTAWIVDYPLFERVHYLLVAGYNVYNAINHQLASRQYMNFLRIDGENNFLRLMPVTQRKIIHNSWYKGLSGKFANYINQPYYSDGYKSRITYQTKNYKAEFFAQLKQQIAQKQASKPNCHLEACIDTSRLAEQQKISSAISALQKFKGYDLAALPEMSLLRVRTQKAENDLVYTLIRNKSLKNVAFIAGESLFGLWEKELDTLTVIPGFVGSYPNFFFNVKQEQLTIFVEALKHAQTDQQKNTFYEEFGILRTNPEIWQYAGWFNAQHEKYRGIHAGLFDLNRYHNL